MASNSTNGKFTVRRLIPLLVLIGGLAAIFAMGWHQHLGFESLRDHRHDLLAWRAANPVAAALGFMAIYVLATAFSVPGGIWLTITGGFLFGLWPGVLLVVLGATVGATVLFLAARHALADVLAARAGEAVKRMEAGFRDNEVGYMLVLRLVPLFPFWLVNLAPAFLGVRVRTYVLCTFFGIMPGAAVYAWVGSGVGTVIDQGGSPDLGLIFSPHILGPLLALSALALIPIVYKKFKRGGPKP